MWFMIGFLAILGNDFDLNFEKNKKKNYLIRILLFNAKNRLYNLVFFLFNRNIGII
jgi:hypothetical protein